MAISIKDMLREMHSGTPFSLKCVKYNKKKKEGGDILEIHEGQLLQPPDEDKIKDQVGRELTGREQQSIEEETAQARRPNHALNYTRNVRILQDGHPTNIIKKIHPPLVIEFNGEETYA